MPDTVRNSLRWTLEVIAPEVTWPDVLDSAGLRTVRLLTTQLFDRAATVSQARSARTPHHAGIGLTPQVGLLGLITDAVPHADRLEAAALRDSSPVRGGPARLALHHAMTAALALRTAEYLDDRHCWDDQRAMYWRAGVAAHWCSHAEINTPLVWAVGAQWCTSHWMATLGWRQHERAVYLSGPNPRPGTRWADIQFRRPRADGSEDVLVISGLGGKQCLIALNAEPLSWAGLCELMMREHLAMPVPDPRHLPVHEYVQAMPEPAIARIPDRRPVLAS